VVTNACCPVQWVYNWSGGGGGGSSSSISL